MDDYGSKRARGNRDQLAELIAFWDAQPMPLIQLRGVLRYGPSRMARELGVSRTFYYLLESREKALSARLVLDILDNWRPELEAAGICCEQLLRCSRPPERSAGGTA